MNKIIWADMESMYSRNPELWTPLKNKTVCVWYASILYGLYAYLFK